MKKSLILTMVTLLVLAFSASGQTFDSLRIMTYNLLNYPNASSTRDPYFRTVLQATNPDILIAQEMTSSAGVTNFLSQVLNYGQPGTYDAATFHNGPDTDNSMFFKIAKVQHILPDTILTTALRDIEGYRLRPVGVTADSLDIQIYSAHLKASTGYESDRAAEALILRNHLNSLPDGGNFMAGGDWNLYTSTEPAWSNLTGTLADNSGRLYDPINSPGSWSSNASFAGIHTQSTRSGTLPDGGSSGGMDDRFDFLLFSQNFQSSPGWEYMAGSYKAFGNDGSHCCNNSINNPYNPAFMPDNVLDALYNASDHVPVILTIRRQIYSGSSLALSRPNGSEIFTAGTQDSIKWSSVNVTGNVTILLNRTYPSGTWDTLFAHTANDGFQILNVTGPGSTTARVRIVSDAQPTVADTSDANFTVRMPTITVTAPNSAVTWYVGTANDITWSSQYLTGTVTITLNRSYSAGSWDTLYTGTANDGLQTWSVVGSVTTSARIRIVSDAVSGVGDTSNVNFTIANPSLLLTSPNGSEAWAVGSANALTWSGTGIQGNVKLELNRSYPSLTWETLYPSTTNDGTESWTVSGPVSTTARMRISSIVNPALGDTSDANFTILHSAAPVIVHDPHGDAVPGNVVFTAKVTDDLPGLVTTLFWKIAAASVWDSVLMTATAYPPEVSATVSLSFNSWQYYIRATDSDPQTVYTNTYNLTVAPACGTSLSYDDGSAELFNWSEQDSFAWAVRFSPAQTPFYLCEASVAVAGFHPDTAHSPIRVQVFNADGPAGLPGTLRRQVARGSVGNVIGGLPGPGAYTARFALYDPQTDPLTFTGDFYVSVANPLGGLEGFSMDTSSALAGRSFVYDACDHQWYADDGLHSTTRRGNRMIRVAGWYGNPTHLTIAAIGDNVQLRWASAGSPNYRIYQSSDADFVNVQYVGSTSDTAYTVVGALLNAGVMHYRITSSSTP
jgi:hypothetical protein